MQNKLRYLSFAKDIWYNDMNLTSVKDVERIILTINKKTNTVNLPCVSSLVSGVYVIGKYGEFYPIFRNERLHNDIIDLAAIDDCEDECNGKLCNMINNYEPVVENIESKMPDGSSKIFRCVTKKMYDVNGDYYEENQYPQRIYTDGVWTDTIVHTEKRFLCKLELDKKGCVKECEDNYYKVLNSGCYSECKSLYEPTEVGIKCIINPEAKDLYGWECGYNFSIFNINNVYNINSEGDRLIFPNNFVFRKILVRYYVDLPLKDIKVPSIAKEAIMTGIKYYDTLLDEKKIQINHIYSQKYAKMKGGVMSMLMKVNSDQQRMIITPPIIIPNFY